ncbi:MAG: DUF2231 domain-containing protein [Rhodanobacteraceae bacterium]
MATSSVSMSHRFALAIYGILDPIPFGMFAGALVFDMIYQQTGEIMWIKAASWLIPFGLIIAIIPRFINLAQVWVSGRATSTGADKLDFWLNLVAIVAAIFNAFVHSRDAYAAMPSGVWLSAATVALIAIGHILKAVQTADTEVYARG